MYKLANANTPTHEQPTDRQEELQERVFYPVIDLRLFQIAADTIMGYAAQQLLPQKGFPLLRID